MSDFLMLKTADMVATALDGAWSSGVSGEVTRCYPDFELDLTAGHTARFDIVPAGIKKVEWLSRESCNVWCSVDIVFRYRFEQVERDNDTGGTKVMSVDECVEQTENAINYLLAHRRIGDSDSYDAWLEDVEVRALTDSKLLRSKVFMSVTRVTYSVKKTIAQPA